MKNAPIRSFKFRSSLCFSVLTAGKMIPSGLLEQLEEPKKPESMKQLIKAPTLCCRTIIIFFNWSVCCSHNAISQNLEYDGFTVFFFNSLLNILLSMLKLARRSNFVQDTPQTCFLYKPSKLSYPTI